MCLPLPRTEARRSWTLERRRLLALVAALAVGLVYSFWVDRPPLADLPGLLTLMVLLWITRAGSGSMPAALRWPLWALIAAYALSSLTSVWPAVSWRSFTGLLAYVYVFLVFGHLLAHGWPRSLVFHGLVLASSGVLLIVLLAWLRDGLPLSGYRLSIETNNSLALAGLLLVSAAAVGIWRRAILGAALWVLWASGSRGGTVGLLAGLGTLAALQPAVWSWLSPRMQRYGLVLSLLAGTGVAWGAAQAVSPHGGRAALWGMSQEMFAAAPLFGQGPDTYQAFWALRYPDQPRYGHAHSLPLTILAEQGLVGAAAAGWLVLSAGRLLWARARSGDTWARGALAAAVGLGVHSLVDTPTTQPYVTVTLLALVQLGLAEAAT